MQDVDKILGALRPAHLPPDSAVLTAGDLALPIAIGLCLALIVSVLWPKRIEGRRRVAIGVREELTRSRLLPPEEALLVQARLLRRVVAARDGEDAATLTGADFAAHLDKSFATDFFSAGPGRRLTTALYAPPDPKSRDEDETGRGLERLFSHVRV